MTLSGTLRKVARSVLVVLLVTFMVVALLSLAPGSVATIILGPAATPESVAALNQELGLDDPVFVQYWDWLVNALHGDLGTSLLTDLPVTEMIADRLPVTLELALLAQIIALGIAVPLAIAAAARPGMTATAALASAPAPRTGSAGWSAGRRASTLSTTTPPPARPAATSAARSPRRAAPAATATGPAGGDAVLTPTETPCVPPVVIVCAGFALCCWRLRVSRAAVLFDMCLLYC